jgi:hypothetical protein
VGGVRRGVLVDDLSCVFIYSSGSFVLIYRVCLILAGLVYSVVSSHRIIVKLKDNSSRLR